MLLVAVVGQFLKLRRRLWDTGWFLQLCQYLAPIGFIAVIAGWTTTEVGRQPWTVYGLLRTADSVSPSLTAANVVLSLALYVVVYLIMFPTGIAFMAGLVRRGPQDADARRIWSKAGCRAGPSRTRRARPRTLRNSEAAMVLDLVPLWTVLLGLAVFYYVVFDGFDLGVGMLHGFIPDPGSRSTAMNSIAPIWDGNETWLVFGGLGLLAAFPLAFTIIIPAVYFPILRCSWRSSSAASLSNSGSGARPFGASGMGPFAADRCWRLLPKESFSVPLSRASRWMGGNSAALHSIGSVRSRSPSAWR